MSDPEVKVGPKYVGSQINKYLISDRKSAADLAIKAIFTVPRIKPTKAQQEVLSQATAAWEYIGKDKIAIRTYTFTPEGHNPTQPIKTVLLSPGHGHASSSMLKFIPPLTSAGHRVVTIDHNAHGASEGSQWDLPLSAETMSVLITKYQHLKGIIGHSMGGTATLSALTTNPDLKCPRLVCMGAGLKVTSIIHFALNKMGIEDMSLQKDMCDFFPTRGQNQFEDVKSLLAAAEVNSRTQLLYVHDRDDKTISFDDARFITSRFTHYKIERTDKLRHHGCLDDDRAVDLATRFMIEQPDLQNEDTMMVSKL